MQSQASTLTSYKGHHHIKKEAFEEFDRPTGLREGTRGSVTVEGAFALAICFFVFAAALCLFNLLGGQVREYIEADERSQKEAVYAALLDNDYSSDIRSYYQYSDKVALLPDSIKSFFFYGEIIRKPWTGRSLNDVSDDDAEEYVYVAENGSVYHVSESCTHLKLSISEVAYADVDSIRNQYGDKYSKCELCGNSYGVMVYVGAEGDRYHSRSSCSGLKRTYSKVKKSECSLPACSRCGG